MIKLPCILALVLFFVCNPHDRAYSQQTSNEKYFLGERWSTKPDSSVKKELINCISYGIDDKFYNFNVLCQYPWEFNKPGNTQFVDINIQVSTVKSSGFYRSFFEDVCFPNNISHPLGSNIYSIDMVGSEKLGLLAGYRFFNHSQNKLFQPVLCAGFVYDASLFSSAISSNDMRYEMGDLLMRFQAMVEYPKGFYITHKKNHSTMQYVTIAIKFGYDIPLQQQHIFNPSELGANILPSFNMGGYFLGVSINFWTYRNKELWKKEAFHNKN